MSTSQTSHMAEEQANEFVTKYREYEKYLEKKELTKNELTFTEYKKLDTKAAGEELIKFQEVKNTPFVIATDKTGIKTNYHVMLGNHRFATHDIYDDAKKDAQTITWDRLINVMVLVMDKLKTVENA